MKLFLYKQHHSLQTLEQSILECLELAATKGHKTISFPALGSGQGYPPEKIASCMIEAVALHSFQYPHTSLETVYIAMLDKDINVIKVRVHLRNKVTCNLNLALTISAPIRNGKISSETKSIVNKLFRLLLSSCTTLYLILSMPKTHKHFCNQTTHLPCLTAE